MQYYNISVRYHFLYKYVMTRYIYMCEDLSCRRDRCIWHPSQHASCPHFILYQLFFQHLLWSALLYIHMDLHMQYYNISVRCHLYIYIYIYIYIYMYIYIFNEHMWVARDIDVQWIITHTKYIIINISLYKLIMIYFGCVTIQYTSISPTTHICSPHTYIQIWHLILIL
jgi:hypothetical protein